MYLQVSGAIGYKEWGKIEKKANKKLFFGHSWSLQGVKNLIKKLIFGALRVPGGALGYANLVLNVCLFFPGN